MAIMRYEPWSLFDQLRREIGQMQPAGEHAPASTSDWVPTVDIREDEGSFTISADIPGVDPKAIEVHAEDGVLLIKGEREVEKHEQRDHYKRIERPYGSFYRRFTLPDNADTTHISARSVNGVLTITIPKGEKSLARKITVDS